MWRMRVRWGGEKVWSRVGVECIVEVYKLLGLFMGMSG